MRSWVDGRVTESVQPRAKSDWAENVHRRPHRALIARGVHRCTKDHHSLTGSGYCARVNVASMKIVGEGWWSVPTGSEVQSVRSCFT